MIIGKLYCKSMFRYVFVKALRMKNGLFLNVKGCVKQKKMSVTPVVKLLL